MTRIILTLVWASFACFSGLVALRGAGDVYSYLADVVVMSLAAFSISAACFFKRSPLFSGAFSIYWIIPLPFIVLAYSANQETIKLAQTVQKEYTALGHPRALLGHSIEAWKDGIKVRANYVRMEVSASGEAVVLFTTFPSGHEESLPAQ